LIRLKDGAEFQAASGHEAGGDLYVQGSGRRRRSLLTRTLEEGEQGAVVLFFGNSLFEFFGTLWLDSCGLLLGS